MWKFVFVFLCFPCTLFAFWPFSWDLAEEKRFLGPLISYQQKDGATDLTLRPFLFSYESGNNGTYHFLYPLGKSTREKTYFVPFYLSRKSEEAEDASFLFFFYGTSKRGDYYGLFPFYGRLYDRFGKDAMGFFLWPLYSFSESEGATKTNFLWPLFSVYTGKEEGFKAWPLYGTRKREGVKHTQFFLWPVFLREEKDLDTREPVNSFYAFPFYLQATSKTKASYHVLFPLFSHSEDEEKKKWGFLFSLYSLTKGEERKGYSFFPFTSYDQHAKDTKRSFFWPLYSKSEWYVQDDRYLQKSVFLINRFIEAEGKIYYNVWPFFEYRKENEKETFFFPSILPFRIETFDRIVRPLITLVERREEDGISTVNMFYGLYTREERGENWRTRFAFLFEMKKESGERGFELFSGLFGIDKDRIKIFFIPFKRH